MFKSGDKAALRATPNILLGTVETKRNHDGLVYVNGTAFFTDGTQNRGKEDPTDIVPFVEAGEKKFWIVRELVERAAVRYYSEEAAASAATHMAQINPGDTFCVFVAAAKYSTAASVTTTTFR